MCKFDIVERDFLLISCLYLCLKHYLSFAYYSPSEIILLDNTPKWIFILSTVYCDIP